MNKKPWSFKEKFEISAWAIALTAALVMAVVMPTVESHQVYLHSAAR